MVAAPRAESVPSSENRLSDASRRSVRVWKKVGKEKPAVARLDVALMTKVVERTRVVVKMTLDGTMKVVVMMRLYAMMKGAAMMRLDVKKKGVVTMRLGVRTKVVGIGKVVSSTVRRAEKLRMVQWSADDGMEKIESTKMLLPKDVLVACL